MQEREIQFGKLRFNAELYGVWKIPVCVGDLAEIEEILAKPDDIEAVADLLSCISEWLRNHGSKRREPGTATTYVLHLIMGGVRHE